MTNTKKVLLGIGILLIPGSGIVAIGYLLYKKWKVEQNEQRTKKDSQAQP